MFKWQRFAYFSLSLPLFNTFPHPLTLHRSNTVIRSGDASDEGVQRDLLPIIEGTTVVTPNGPIRTNHILFIAAGAFHSAKPTDLLAELQGRLPIKVNLSALSEEDMYRVLTEPSHNLLEQQSAMLATEGLFLKWQPEAIRRLAQVATELNLIKENIGARRLYSVVEHVVEELSFEAADMPKGSVIEITKEMVDKRMEGQLKQSSFDKFIL